MVLRNDQDVEMLELVLEMMRQLKHFTSRVAEDYSLSIAQVHLMWRLGGDEPVSMGLLAEELHCDPSNITGIVHKLEETGLIERMPHPKDRRVKCLSLTDKGERVRTEIAQQVAHELPLTSGLSEQEQLQLQALMIKALNTSSI